MAKTPSLLIRTAILLLVSPVLGSIFAIASLIGMAKPAVLILAAPTAMYGAVIGAVMSPLPALCLQRGPLRQALAFVGIATSLAAMLGGWFAPMTPYPAIWASVAYIVSCLSWFAFSFFLPGERITTTNALVCSCGYDLIGLEPKACAECGESAAARMTVTPNAPTRRRRDRQ